MDEEVKALEKRYTLSGIRIKAICHMAMEQDRRCDTCTDFTCPVCIELIGEGDAKRNK